MYLYAYKQGSQSGKDLANALGIRRIKHEGSRFRGGPHKTVINWGASQLPEEVMKCRVLNSPEAVALCSNKLKFFKALEGQPVNLPEFTQDKEEALKWLGEGLIVFARTKLNGHSGEGIVEIHKLEDMVEAPLYVKYIPKRDEYRVHIFQGEVLSIQRKALRGDMNREEANFRVRNLANGFIFARNEDKECPECVTEQAKSAFNLITSLDFCSVDVIYNEYRDKAYVLEINTASGLAGTTLDEYVAAFQKI